MYSFFDVPRTVLSLSTKSRSEEHRRSVRDCDYKWDEIEKQSWEINHNFSWDQKEVVNFSKDQRNYTFFEEF